MKYVQSSFDKAVEKDLCPPDDYENWAEYDEDSWEPLEYTNGIWIVHDDGSSDLVAQDGGEPEDNSFVRDGAWIVGELNRAFRAGFIRGYNDGYGSLQIDEGVSP